MVRECMGVLIEGSKRGSTLTQYMHTLPPYNSKVPVVVDLVSRACGVWAAAGGTVGGRASAGH